MRDNKAIGIFAGAIALGSALGLSFYLSDGFGPHLDSTPYEAVGRALARQTLALLKPGGRVTVITRDTATFQNPATDIQLNSFRKELAKSGAKIDSVQVVQIDPLRPMAVPAGDFFQSIKNSTKGDVLVSFMGPPILTPTQLGQLGEVAPGIVAFCSGPSRDQVDLRILFSQKLLQAAVVSKRPADIKRGAPASGSEMFDRQYIEVTAANLAALTSVSNPAP